MGKSSQATRQERKAKKRAAVDLIPDIPEGKLELGNDFNSTVLKEEVKTEKKNKKRKRDKIDEPATQLISEKRSKKSKKSGKKISKDETVMATSDEGPEIFKNEKEKEVSKMMKKTMKKDNKEIMVKKQREDKFDETIITLNSGHNDKPVKKSKKERKAELKSTQLATQELTLISENTCTKPVNTKTILNKVGSHDRKVKDSDLITDTTHTEKKEPQSHVTNPSQATVVGLETDKPPRFIIFVGNLPYTATMASVKAHFAKLRPISVRLLTSKEDPSKSRGVAFVEFENYDTHKTALKTMHQSTFDDGLSGPRKINVELTAGGGGNKDCRRAKIKSKNERLNEQRTRLIQEDEKKVKVHKAVSVSETALGESAIHPSRRKMISV